MVCCICECPNPVVVSEWSQSAGETMDFCEVHRTKFPWEKLTAWDAYQKAKQRETIYRRGWYFAGREMWHQSWTVQRVPWQWGPEELEARDWIVVLGKSDPRPTVAEARQYLADEGGFGADSDVALLYAWKPGMFRAEIEAEED